MAYTAVLRTAASRHVGSSPTGNIHPFLVRRTMKREYVVLSKVDDEYYFCGWAGTNQPRTLPEAQRIASDVVEESGGPAYICKVVPHIEVTVPILKQESILPSGFQLP